MKDAQGDPAYGRTNWRRFAVAVGIPTIGAAGLVLALANGALAASFTVSGQSFKLSATSLTGTGFTQYSGQLNTADPTKPQLAAMSGIASADISNLCQTVAASTPLGPVVMRIDAGGNGTAAHADNLLIGMSDLQGDATFTNMQIGQDASTLNADGASTHGQVGSFGQQASTVQINNLKQTAYSTSAGKFILNGMHLHLYVGGDASSHECF